MIERRAQKIRDRPAFFDGAGHVIILTVESFPCDIIDGLRGARLVGGGFLVTASAIFGKGQAVKLLQFYGDDTGAAWDALRKYAQRLLSLIEKQQRERPT